MAFFRARLVDKKGRERSTKEIVASLRPKFANIPDAKVRISEGRSMYTGILGGGSEERLEIDLKGYDLEQGKAIAEEIV
ncbi:MAG: hypothetical protein JRI71_16350, partial [Deltaproteobacteria bacterium]|nr:hypothetical protein [Deltaproteobacteria bacterium]